MARVMIADDEREFRSAVALVLSRGGHEVRECGTSEEALSAIRKEAFDVVLTDLRMPGVGGIAVLREAAARFPDAVLIVLTAYGSLESAIEALRIGAHDFVLKPVNLEALARKVDFLAGHQATIAENRFLRGALGIDAPPTGLVGESAGMREVRQLIDRVAATDTTVLVTGETGTGKELVARAIHHGSPRGALPLVTVNCGSIPEALLESELFGHVRGAFTGADRDKRGLFEVAGRGTIFLDEIGELPLPLQPKILRALENREVMRVGGTTPVAVQARLVAATHRDLREESSRARFRQDLYFRLNVFEIRIPPLRTRREDIPRLAIHLVERIAGRMGRVPPSLDPGAVAALAAYEWPGNVRELSNVLERALLLSDGPRIGAEALRGLAGGVEAASDDLRTARQAFERAHILRVVEKHGGDKRQAAKALGIDLSNLYRKLEE